MRGYAAMTVPVLSLSISPRFGPLADGLTSLDGAGLPPPGAPRGNRGPFRTVSATRPSNLARINASVHAKDSTMMLRWPAVATLTALVRELRPRAEFQAA